MEEAASRPGGTTRLRARRLRRPAAPHSAPCLLPVALASLLQTGAACAEELTAADLVRAAMDHWRGLTSYSEMSMTIHRPDWERTMSLVELLRDTQSRLS